MLQGKEAEKFAGLAALPPIDVALADKYSHWDPAVGEFTHSKDGVALDAKASVIAEMPAGWPNSAQDMC